MTQYLHGLGYVINHKRVQRLMRTLGLAGSNTSKPHPQHIVIRLCAENLDILQADLLGMYGDLPTEELTKVMSLAFAAADLAGRFDVSQGQ